MAKRTPFPFQLELQRSDIVPDESREWRVFSNSTIKLITELAYDIQGLEADAKFVAVKGSDLKHAMVRITDAKGNLVLSIERRINTKNKTMKSVRYVIGETYAGNDIPKRVSTFTRSLTIGFKSETITATIGGDNALYSYLRKGMLPKKIETLDAIISNNSGYLTRAQVRKWYSLTRLQKREFILSAEFKEFKAVLAGRSAELELDLTDILARKAYFAASRQAPRTTEARAQMRRDLFFGAREDSRADAIQRAIRQQNNPKPRSLLATLRNSYISYGTDLQGFEENEVRKVREILEAAEVDAIQRIQDDDPGRPGTAEQRRRRLGTTLLGISSNLFDTFDIVSSLVLSDLNQLAKLESQFNLRAINSAVGVDLASKALTPGQLKSIAGDAILDGAPQKEWWSRQAERTRRQFADALRVGLVQGETTEQLIQRVRGTATGRRVPYRLKSGALRYKSEFSGGIISGTKREVETLVRTSIQSVSQRARLATYDASSDVIAGIQVLSTLDARTTIICQNYSGKAWTLIGRVPINHFDPFPGHPPYHFNCRSTLVPILKGWEQLAPANKKDLARQYDEKDREVNRQQASVDGPVDADLDYQGWLRTLSEARQREILGNSRYKIWRDGDINICAPPSLR